MLACLHSESPSRSDSERSYTDCVGECGLEGSRGTESKQAVELSPSSKMDHYFAIGGFQLGIQHSARSVAKQILTIISLFSLHYLVIVLSGCTFHCLYFLLVRSSRRVFISLIQRTPKAIKLS